MQALRRAAASRLLAQWEGSGASGSSISCGGALQQLQQQAGFAKKSESMDSRLQRVLRMLEPREVEKVELSDEDFQEGEQRCGTEWQGCRRRRPPPARPPARLLWQASGRLLTAPPPRPVCSRPPAEPRSTAGGRCRRTARGKQT